jgi:hypothetical protein
MESKSSKVLRWSNISLLLPSPLIVSLYVLLTDIARHAIGCHVIGRFQYIASRAER